MSKYFFFWTCMGFFDGRGVLELPPRLLYPNVPKYFARRGFAACAENDEFFNGGLA